MEKATFEQRLEGDEEGSRSDIPGKIIPDNSHKGPVALRNSVEKLNLEESKQERDRCKKRSEGSQTL